MGNRRLGGWTEGLLKVCELNCQGLGAHVVCLWGVIHRSPGWEGWQLEMWLFPPRPPGWGESLGP